MAKSVIFFYPVLPDALDRIYIGISVSLFANHWGASFLLELLKHLKPGGSIIVPVYPEGQAAEKDFWSRSFLENIFLSRERWTGFSNLTAENDGVMSIRVGRKWPAPMPSSIEWFFKERGNLLLADLQSGYSGNDLTGHLKNAFVPLCTMMWNQYSASAVTERVITEYVGKKQASTLMHIGQDYGLLANDVILSPMMNLEKGVTWHVGDHEDSLANSISRYFSAHTQEKHVMNYGNLSDVAFNDPSNVIVISDLYSSIGAAKYKQLLDQAWAHLAGNGVLVVREDLSGNAAEIAQLDVAMSALGEVDMHSSIAARKIETAVEISQYSLAVEENLRQEKLSKDNIFRVVHKA